MSRDFYEMLGVPRHATEDEIRKAYRRLARRHHPDVNREDPKAEARFKEIGEAYEVLSDPERRRNYDIFGTAKPGPAFGGGFGGFGGFESPFDDLFGMFFGDWQTRGRAGGRERGSDLTVELTVAFEEAIFGAKKEVEIARLAICNACSGGGIEPGTHPERCRDCGGTGKMSTSRQTFFGTFMQTSICPACRGSGQVITSPCPECGGQGRRPVSEKIAVEVPAGVSEGDQMRVNGKGEAGLRGRDGDLYVVLHVKPHPIFERVGADIMCRFPITFPQAALGAELQVPTVDGFEKLRIPKGTQTGTQFRLRARGAPDLRSGRRGDQIVEVAVETPTNLTREQRELIEQYARAAGEDLSGPSGGILGKIKDAFSG